jgi:toxin ParE1/3/4
MKVRYNRGAASDLDDILAYLKTYSPRAAARQLEKFEQAVRVIAEYPYVGAETGRQSFRRHVVGQYLMVYQVEPDVITIHYVRHGARKRPWEGE